MAAASRDGETLYKIAGCAQMRKRHAILVHGVLLLDADIALFSRYLRYPSEAPNYRSGRSHEEFCRNISAVLGRKILPPEMAQILCAEAQRRGWQWRQIPSCLDAEAEALYHQKYLCEGWHWRRERNSNLPAIPPPPLPLAFDKDEVSIR